MADKPIQLKVVAGPNNGETCIIYRAETSIGRDKKNDIVILDPSISRTHALIKKQADDFVIQDLNSTNGTFVNKDKISSLCVLKPGDFITLGEHIQFQFSFAEDDPNATLHSVKIIGSPLSESSSTQQVNETQKMSRSMIQKEQSLQISTKAPQEEENKAFDTLHSVPLIPAIPEQPKQGENEASEEPTSGEEKKGGLIDLSSFIAQVKQNNAQTQAASTAGQQKEEEVDLNLPVGVRISKQAESNLTYNLDEDPDLWLMLFFGFIVSGGKKSEELKQAFIDNNDEWKKFIDEVRTNNLLLTLTAIARDRLTRWNIIIVNLLADQGHSHLFHLYLQALMAQKIKKVVGFGGRAQLKKQLNIILAVIAGNLLGNLDKYDEAALRLAKGKKLDGTPLTETLIKFYEPSKAENLKQISLLMAVIVIFRNATCADDIKKLQDFIRINLVNPLTLEADALPSGYDKTQANKRIEGYMQLIKTVDISFG